MSPATSANDVRAFRRTGLIVAGLIFLADQFIKWLMIGPLALQSRGVIEILPIFALRWTENHGVSLGMLTASSDTARWALVGMTAVIATGVAVWILREKARWDIVALSMVLGGALGNIVDRARFGYVVDFLDLHFGEFRPFLIFNVADAAIVLGVALLLARSLFLREKPANSPSSSSPESS